MYRASIDEYAVVLGGRMDDGDAMYTAMRRLLLQRMPDSAKLARMSWSNCGSDYTTYREYLRHTARDRRRKPSDPSIRPTGEALDNHDEQLCASGSEAGTNDLGPQPQPGSADKLLSSGSQDLRESAGKEPDDLRAMSRSLQPPSDAAEATEAPGAHQTQQHPTVALAVSLGKTPRLIEATEADVVATLEGAPEPHAAAAHANEESTSAALDTSATSEKTFGTSAAAGVRAGEGDRDGTRGAGDLVRASPPEVAANGDEATASPSVAAGAAAADVITRMSAAAPSSVPSAAADERLSAGLEDIAELGDHTGVMRDEKPPAICAKGTEPPDLTVVGDVNAGLEPTHPSPNLKPEGLTSADVLSDASALSISNDLKGGSEPTEKPSEAKTPSDAGAIGARPEQGGGAWGGATGRRGTVGTGDEHGRKVKGTGEPGLEGRGRGGEGEENRGGGGSVSGVAEGATRGSGEDERRESEGAAREERRGEDSQAESAEAELPPHSPQLSSRVLFVGDGILPHVDMVAVFDDVTAPITRVRFARLSSSLLAYSAADGTLRVAEITDPPKTLHKLEGHTKEITDFDWSSSDQFLCSCSLDRSVRVWSVSDGQCLRIIYSQIPKQCIRFHPLNNNLLLVANADRDLLALNFSTGREVGKLHLPHKLCAMDVDQASLLFAGDSHGTIHSISADPLSGSLHSKHRSASGVSHPAPVCSLTFRPFSLLAQGPVLLACAMDGTVRFYSVSLELGGLLFLKCSLQLSSAGTNIRAAFCPPLSTPMKSGELIVTGNADHNVHFYDFMQPKKPLVARVKGHISLVADVSWNQGGDLLASSDDEGVVIVWRKQEKGVEDSD